MSQPVNLIPAWVMTETLEMSKVWYLGVASGYGKGVCVCGGGGGDQEGGVSHLGVISQVWHQRAPGGDKVIGAYR